MESSQVEEKSRRKLPFAVSLWVLGVLAATMLAAIGVLSWRFVVVSGEVDELTEALAATTSEDPWSGYHSRYISVKNDIVELRTRTMDGLLSLEEPHDWADIGATVLELAFSLGNLPYSPQTVKDAEDEYYEGLMDIHAAASSCIVDPSTANRLAYVDALVRELRLFETWLSEIERAR